MCSAAGFHVQTKSEIESRADFSRIRYAQCWEDADILVKALNIQRSDTCLSIASAGDNALALLAQKPERVIALDMNPAQLACVELRVAAYRELEWHELLQLMGSRESRQRAALYQRCRPLLSADVRRFWDSRSDEIARGIGSAGKFERYFKTFARRVMPLIHSKKRIHRLLQGGDLQQRQDFYNYHWNNWRWRLLFKLFFSRFMMGRLGRDPEFFKYVEGSVAEHILKHTRYALTELNPSENPYLQWILLGRHDAALPYALREENFTQIRDNLDRFEWHLMPVEEYLERHPDQIIHKYNLSDIFEYMSDQSFETLLTRLHAASTHGGRLAYWNMLVPRSRPATMADRLKSLEALSEELYRQDKAFFYSAFVVEEVL